MSRGLLKRIANFARENYPVQMNGLIAEIEVELKKSEPEPLTDDEILMMWSGSDMVRPILGKNKVLRFARAIERRVRGEI